jgi:hypothetical protein
LFLKHYSFVIFNFLKKSGLDLPNMPNNSLIALVLLVAESNPKENDTMTKLIA